MCYEFFQLMERHCSWDSILISIYQKDANLLKNGNANAKKWWGGEPFVYEYEVSLKIQTTCLQEGTTVLSWFSHPEGNVLAVNFNSPSFIDMLIHEIGLSRSVAVDANHKNCYRELNSWKHVSMVTFGKWISVNHQSSVGGLLHLNSVHPQWKILEKCTTVKKITVK